jgi:cytosine/adenosine deaminase-related metal-dependent hydrolase
VSLGLGFDLYFLGPALVGKLFGRAKELGVRTITSHAVCSAQMSLNSVPALLEKFGVLDESILLSHATGCDEADVALLKKAGAHVSCTPVTELQMGHGAPVAWRTDVPEVHELCSLGIDCHSNNSASMVETMRLGLQAGRGMWNEKFMAKGITPKQMHEAMRVERAFNLGTIREPGLCGWSRRLGV